MEHQRGHEPVKWCSGADATILPSDYLGVGVEADEDEPALQDPKKPQ